MIVASDFKPHPLLRGPHAQTVFASVVRRPPPLPVTRERLELDDGDFLDLAWLPEPENARADTPLVMVLHGLTGSIDSKYARGLLRQVRALGWRGLLMHFRGAGGEPNRLPRGYHSGETGDFTTVLARLRQRYPGAPLAAVGYSLGGNVLLKYLGEQGAGALLTTACAVSVPFDLARCARAMDRGLSRAYQRHLLGNMRRAAERKFALIKPPFELPDLDRLGSFYVFDDAITAPLHGFAGVDDYYARASSGPFLKDVRVPVLILHARDDPFMDPAVMPAETDLADSIRLELSEHGGHVGFVAADRCGRPVYWLERRIPAFLRERLLSETPPESLAGEAIRP